MASGMEMNACRFSMIKKIKRRAPILEGIQRVFRRLAKLTKFETESIIIPIVDDKG